MAEVRRQTFPHQAKFVYLMHESNLALKDVQTLIKILSNNTKDQDASQTNGSGSSNMLYP